MLLEIAWCTKTKPTERIPKVTTMVFNSLSEIMMCGLVMERMVFVKVHTSVGLARCMQASTTVGFLPQPILFAEKQGKAPNGFIER